MKWWEFLTLIVFAITGEWATGQLEGFMGLRHLVWVILLGAIYIIGLNRGTVSR